MKAKYDKGVLEILVDPAVLAARPDAKATVPAGFGFGRELFAHMRSAVGPADAGASVFFS